MEDKGFSKIRSFLWPIRRKELSKFLPILVLFFLIAFNYHILKILKDTLIITAKHSGAEVIPFLKVWAILPSAILLTFLFTKLSSKLNRENIFYVMLSLFVGFFTLFIFVIYPNADSFNLTKSADFLSNALPSGFKGMIAIIRYWHFSLFYIMAEAWSTIMLSLLLWIFVVDVLSIDEAKRYYSFFGTSRNISGAVAGLLGEYLAMKAINDKININFISTFFKFKTSWDQSMFFFMVIVIVTSLIIMGLYRYLHINVFPERKYMGGDIKNKGKQKVSFKESLLYAVKSKYVLYITLMVLSYNVLINLTEVVWKDQINHLYPSSSLYTAYSSKITFITGILAAFSSFFLSGNIVRRLGWKVAALVTPIALMLTSFSFFYFVFIKKYAANSNIALTLFGISPLILSVFFGSLQNVFARGFKYTLFDDTKEMAFIPLLAEEKLKGKAAIDGIGSRLGKSGSSFMMQILMFGFATPTGASPIIFVIILLILPIWIIAINRLSKEFEAKTGTATKELKIS